MKNIDITALDGMAPGDVAELPAAVLRDLTADLEKQADLMKKRRAVLDAGLERRYGQRAAEARLAAGKDTGAIRLTDGDSTVVADLPKRVKWDQTVLRTLLDSMSPEDARHYAKVEVKIDERKFAAAPPAIQALLAPARVVETGKPSFTIEPANKEAA